MADSLTDRAPAHWTTRRQSMTGLAVIDGKSFRFCGRTRPGAPDWHHHGEPQAMVQQSVAVLPTTSRYVFEAGGVELAVAFATPLLIDNLDILSRPVSYVDFTLRSLDGKEHRAALYFDVSAELAVDSVDQRVQWGCRTLGEGTETLYAGTWEQNILGRRGDDLRIDWGYVHLAAPGSTDRAAGNSAPIVEAFLAGRALETKPSANRGVPVRDNWPVLACVFDLGTLSPDPSAAASRFLAVGYEDIYSVEYLGDRLKAYCFRNGMSFDGVLSLALKEHSAVLDACARQDASLLKDAEAAGGKTYAELCALAYRQAIAAHALVADVNGDVLFFSKECFSNGCMATVDVTYPSAPLFLAYNPELLKGMLRPILRYAAGPAWPFPYAPHDMGVYPRANGQAYGATPSGFDESRQMPVEECGNMLILMAAVARLEGNPSFSLPHWELLEAWAAYLKEKGYDPESQLCTDDFSGHLAHNANLSVKAIVALAAFGDLCAQRGLGAEAEEYRAAARDFAQRWEEKALDQGFYRLAFDKPGSWSLKYNLIWDLLLGYGLFGDAVYARETAHYAAKLERYGVPLDSRDSFTKSDWLVWAACLSDDRSYFSALIGSLWKFLDETPDRTPFCDWYGTTDAVERSFHHRSVVGGVFMKVLKEKMKSPALG